MHILNNQHNIINSIFPDYNREKSYVLFEAGTNHKEYFNGVIHIKIYKKGRFRISMNKEGLESCIKQ